MLRYYPSGEPLRRRQGQRFTVGGSVELEGAAADTGGKVEAVGGTDVGVPDPAMVKICYIVRNF